MEVFHEEEERLHLALAQQKRLDAVERALAALGRIKCPPRVVLHGDVENREDLSPRGPQRLPERGKPCRHALGQGIARVVLVQFKVCAKQMDNWEPCGRLIVRDRAAAQHFPTGERTGLEELPVESRLAHAGLAHDTDDLAAAACGLLPEGVEHLQLRAASDEGAQAARRSSRQSALDRARPEELEYLDGLGQTLDCSRSKGFEGDKAIHESQRLGREDNRAGRGELFHAGREVRRLPDRGVVHVQVTSDRPHDHLTRVQADADPHLHAEPLPRVWAEPLHVGLHGERRVARA